MRSAVFDHTARVRAAAPRWRDRRTAADLAVRDALQIIGGVRDHDPELVFGDLALRARHDTPRLLAAVVALAAMVPPDSTPAELLAWTTQLAGADDDA